MAANPNGVERFIAPGANPGYGHPYDLWNPEWVILLYPDRIEDVR